MMKRLVAAPVLIVLLIVALMLTFNIQPAKASGTIYISSDYTFTSNIYEPIVVTADNIIIDGAGYTVQGNGTGTGIDLSDRNNVTLKNVEVTNFTCGILLRKRLWLDFSCNNNVLSGNTASSNNEYGIFLQYSNNNVLTGNTASSNNYHGIRLQTSNNNTITGNTASSNIDGINLDFSSNNTITGNTASSNNDVGIWLDFSCNNNVLSGNTASNNEHGIFLGISSNGVLTGNTASSNNEYGIFLQYSNNSVLTGNTASNNNVGIRLDHSSNNTVVGNIASNNSVAGIYLRSSSNNVLFHNNLINNTVQANVTFGDANMWNDDYPSGGNYWSDYEERYPNATELAGSGIWDTPYVIDENNQDNYPIVSEFLAWTSMLLILIMLTAAIVICKRRLLKTPIN